MDKLLGGAQGVLIGSPLRGDDFVDRLHYFITAAILLVLAAGITYKETTGKPVDCFPPPEFKEEGAKETVNTYCFARTLSLPHPHHLDSNETYDPHGGPEHEALIMDFGTSFYKWAPLILAIMALTFKGPKMLWTKMSGRPGEDLRTIRDLVLEARTVKKVRQRQRKMNAVVNYVETFVTGWKTYKFPIIGENNGKFLAIFFCLGRKSGSYLSSLYLFVKILNFFNLILNFGLLSSFLDKSYWRYGYDGLKSIFTTGDWGDKHNFPRMLICDFEMPTPQEQTTDPSTGASSSTSSSSSEARPVFEVKCMMSINLMLEKIFLVFYFWLIALFFVTLANMVLWFFRIKEPFSHVFFIKDYMKIVYQSQAPQKDDDRSSSSSSDSSSVFISDVERDMIERFVEDYIKSDGVFLLRLLELNADRSIAADVIIVLWNRYKKLQTKGSKANVQRIERIILENENKNAHMAKFLGDAQNGRKTRSNVSLSRAPREVLSDDMKCSRSVPLLSAAQSQMPNALAGPSAITGVAQGGDNHPMAMRHLQDMANNNPGSVSIPMQELGNKLGEIGGLGVDGLGGGLLDNVGGGVGGLQIPGSLGGMKLPGGLSSGGGMELPGGLSLPGGLGGGGGMELPGGLNLPGGLGGGGGMELPGGLNLPGGLGGGGGMELPGGLNLPGGLGGGGGMELPGGLNLPGGLGGGGGMELPGGLNLPGGLGGGGGMDLPGGMQLPGGLSFGGGDKEGGGGGGLGDSVGGLFNQRF